VSGQSNPQILSQAVVVNGVLNYQGVTDVFGQVVVSLTGQGVDGRPYAGTVKITITPLTRQFAAPDQIVPENSGQHVVNLLPLMGLSSPNQLASLTVSGQSNPQILSQAAVVNGALNYQGVTDVFGQVVVSLTGQGVDGRPYAGTVKITITPLTRQFAAPDQIVMENSGQHVVNLLP
ncbi:MAG: hypothetical protein LR011_12605, partial [Verrucomicrobia bacterium]|nr:hypothetical protein [Verrucomicrobiota bacterium]